MLAAPADANGEPGSASVWMGACPLPGRDWINRRIFLAPGRQRCEFSYQYAAGNVRGPVDTREDFSDTSAHAM